MPLLFEFKARSNSNAELEKKLQTLQPYFKGEDHQLDTYFNVATGRLKMREGNIENTLIHYHRENSKGAKQSDVLLYQLQSDSNLKQLLTKALGIKILVEKKRRIWFVKNVKIHFDTVGALGDFVEVEAIDENGNIGLQMLKEQCAEFALFFGIEDTDYVATSYSDLLLEIV